MSDNKVRSQFNTQTLGSGSAQGGMNQAIPSPPRKRDARDGDGGNASKLKDQRTTDTSLEKQVKAGSYNVPAQSQPVQTFFKK